jgi:hypothetical protein
LMSPILPFWSAVLSWCITGPSFCTKGLCNMTQFSSPMGKLPWLTRHYWLDQQISDHKSVVFQKHIHKLWIQGHLSQPSHYSRLMSRWSNTHKGNVHAQFNRCTGQERSEFVIYEAKMLRGNFRFIKPTNMRWWQLHHRLQSLLHKIKGIKVPLHMMISESPCGCSSIRVSDLSLQMTTPACSLRDRYEYLDLD